MSEKEQDSDTEPTELAAGNTDSRSGDAEAATEELENDTANEVDANRDDPLTDKASTPDSAADQTGARRPGRLSALAAWLALAIALATALFTASQWLDRGDAGKAIDRADAEISALSNAVAAVRDAQAELQQRLTALAGNESASQRALEGIERQLEDRLRRFESVPGRMSNLENSIGSLQGISSGVRDSWLLAEAEYFMQIASAQLQLAGNPRLATVALQQADERILQLADPSLTEVRRAIANELQALDVMVKPDVEGITLTLASLAAVVDSLPLREQLARALPEDTETEIDAELSGMDRALATLKRTMSRIVSVRRSDEEIQPLLAPKERYFLRANLALQLQAARLAMLRGEQSIYEQSLDDADTWLKDFYDTDSAPVTSALETIAEIKDASFSVTPPDISESLRLLRQHNVLAESAGETERVEPEPSPEPAQ